MPARKSMSNTLLRVYDVRKGSFWCESCEDAGCRAKYILAVGGRHLYFCRHCWDAMRHAVAVVNKETTMKPSKRFSMYGSGTDHQSMEDWK